jgi:hypothetical protein
MTASGEGSENPHDALPPVQLPSVDTGNGILPDEVRAAADARLI